MEKDPQKGDQQTKQTQNTEKKKKASPNKNARLRALKTVAARTASSEPKTSM